MKRRDRDRCTHLQGGGASSPEVVSGAFSEALKALVDTGFSVCHGFIAVATLVTLLLLLPFLFIEEEDEDDGGGHVCKKEGDTRVFKCCSGVEEEASTTGT